MIWLWLIVAIVLLAISAYCIGRFQLELDGEVVGLFWICFIGCLLWPVVLCAVIIIGPFFGLFWLGDRRREKKKAVEKTNEQK